LGTLCYSQSVGTYKYKTTLTVTDGNSHVVDCDNWFSFWLCGNAGCYQIQREVNLDDISNTWTYRDSTYVSSGTDMSYYKTHSERHWKNAGGCTGSDGDRVGTYVRTTAGCSKGYNDVMTEWASNLTIERIPQLTIVDNRTWNSPFNYFEIDDPNGIVIQSHTGFLPSEYNWEYIDPLADPLAPIVWLPFTDTQTRKYSGLSSLTLTLADINTSKPPKNPRSFYQSTLSIRQVGVGTGCNYASKQVDYTLVKTPPLVKSITSTATQCAYSKDGTIEIEFNRPLETDEKFGPNNLIYQTVKIIPDVAIVPNPNSNTKFTISGLPPETYKLTYQTNFPVGPNVYNSERKTIEPIVIGSPPALKYTARMAQPKCATDGAEIVINATSGGTPPYSYTIKGTIVKPDKTTTNFEITKEFTNSAGTPNADHGQPNGDYIIPLDPELNGPVSIKVTDKNKCIDGNKTAP
jgi:hypothetical protein